MPNVESHVSFCLREFGVENRELCYMVNSWIDAPVRTRGSYHRAFRHNQVVTPFEACSIYGDASLYATSKNILIAHMVLQHLRLDGLISPFEEKAWKWSVAANLVRKMQKANLLRKIIMTPLFIIFFVFGPILFLGGLFSGYYEICLVGMILFCLSPMLIYFYAYFPGTQRSSLYRSNGSEYRKHQRESQEEMEQIESDMWDEDQHLM